MALTKNGNPWLIEYMTAGSPMQSSFIARGRVIKECENGLVEVVDIETGHLVGVPERRFVRDIPAPEDLEPHIAALELEREKLIGVRSAIVGEIAIADQDELLELLFEKNRVDARLGKVFEILVNAVDKAGR